MTHTHVSAPTRFVEANGIRYAYRRFGKEAGAPLLFMQHFRGGSVRLPVGIAYASRRDEVTTSEQQRINLSSGLIIPPPRRQAWQDGSSRPYRKTIPSRDAVLVPKDTHSVGVERGYALDDQLQCKTKVQGAAR